MTAISTKDLVSCEMVSRKELHLIQILIDRLMERYKSVEGESFADECYLAAQELPLRLRKIFHEFRNRKTSAGYLLLQGFSWDDDSIGPTPSHWDAPWDAPNTLRQEIFQYLISSSAGEIFGWLTQENGRYLRHIVPIKSDRKEQLGGSSDVTLLWHVEEAFHPHRADMMTIMCYRNEEEACTNICSATDMDIPKKYWDVLSQPRFIIKPDASHSPENNKSAHWNLDEVRFSKIRKFLEDPAPVAVLEGVPGEENLLVDEAFMEALPGDHEAAEALEWLFQHMNDKKRAIVMKPGDILLIDNRMTAHGRSPYVPNYGPKARWLRRVNITTDLRKSYLWKEKPYGRVIL